MARVPIPTQDAPSVLPGGGAIPYLKVNVGPEAFGAQVGQAAEAGAGRIGRAEIQQAEAVGQLGKATEQFGDVLAKHAIRMQTELIDADADEKFLAATVSLGELEAWHRSLEGKAALDAMPEFSKRAMAIREKYRNSIATPYGQRKFDQEFSRRLGYTMVNGGIYSAGEFKDYRTKLNKAVVAQQQQTFANSPETSGTQIDDDLETIEKKAREGVFKSGGSEQQAEIAASVAVSNAMYHKVQKMVAENRPQDAHEFLNKYGHRMTDPNLFSQARHLTDNGLNDQTSRFISDQVNLEFRKRDPGEPGLLDEKLKRAEQLADQVKKDDPKFKDTVISRVRADTNVDKAKRADDIQGHLLVMNGAVQREVQSPDGGTRLLYDKSQFTPQERMSYDRLGSLDPAKQRAIDKALKQNAVFGKEWTDEMRTEYYKWAEIGNKALAGDPQAREEFIKLVPGSLDIPQSGNPGGRHALWQLQQRVLNNVPDTHVSHVMGVMSHMIKDAQLDQASQAKLQVDLVEAVKRHQAENGGKRPNDEQIIEMGKKLLRDEYHDKWYHWFWPGTKLFQREVPSAEKPKIIESLKRSNALRGGSPDYEPDADEIQKVYTHQLYLNEKRK